MQLISAQNGRLLTLSALEGQGRCSPARSFHTDLAALDELLPQGAWACGAIHEFLTADRSVPLFFAALVAGSAVRDSADAPILWCDPQRTLYPPALAGLGISLKRLLLLHPHSDSEALWAVTECLRCKGVGAVVAEMGRLSQIQVRRLQLAAECGGGVGLLLRPLSLATRYAAATRWLINPVPGERTVQRWRIQLLHGHGGRLDQSVILEHSRETHRLRATAELADRSAPATSSPLRAIA